MAIKHSTGLANLALDSGIGTAFDTDGRIDIYTGSAPANADADVTGTLLGTLALSADAFQAAASRAIAANAVTSDTNADASGTAGWFRVYDASEGVGGVSTTKKRIDGTVTASGGGGDMILDNTAITLGGTIACTSFTYTHPV